MKELLFHKVQSVGNDFILLRLEDVQSCLGKPVELSGTVGTFDSDLSPIAKALCHRKLGIGSDGLLILGQDANDSLWLRMFNPDGSEDFCGNGIRCAAHFAYKMNLVGQTFSIHHGRQIVPVSIDDQDWVQTTIAPGTTSPASVPTTWTEPMLDVPLSALVANAPATFTASAYSTGTAHLVVRGKPTEEEFQQISPLLESHTDFPEKTSIMWLESLNDFEIRLRIWERGVGETQGCGSGSAASALDQVRTTGKPGTVAVHNPGGMLKLMVTGLNEPLNLIGRAEVVYAGTVSELRTALASR